MTHRQCLFIACVVYAFAVPGVIACAALSSVTPDDRARAYKAHAAGIGALCKAYRFDRATGLVGEVPSMTEACSK
jgi:hypothetical protein